MSTNRVPDVERSSYAYLPETNVMLPLPFVLSEGVDVDRITSVPDAGALLMIKVPSSLKDAGFPLWLPNPTLTSAPFCIALIKVFSDPSMGNPAES